MASHYTILQSDIAPGRIPESELAQLLKDYGSASQGASFDQAVLDAEDDFHSLLGGRPTTAAAMALCRPQAIAVLIWNLYTRNSRRSAAEISAAVKTPYDNACKWAAGNGARILASEGGQSAAAGSNDIAYDAPRSRFSMEQLDSL